MGHFVSITSGMDHFLFRAGKKLGNKEGYSATEAVPEAIKQAAKTGKPVTIEHVPETDRFVLRKTEHKMFGIIPDPMAIEECFYDPHTPDPSLYGKDEDVALVTKEGDIFHIAHDGMPSPSKKRYFVDDSDVIVKDSYYKTEK